MVDDDLLSCKRRRDKLKRKDHNGVQAVQLGTLPQRHFFCIITSRMIGYQVEGAYVFG